MNTSSAIMIAARSPTPEIAARLFTMGNALTYVVVIDGQIVGSWRRTLNKEAVTIEINPFRRLTKAEQRAVATAAQRYGEFLENACDADPHVYLTALPSAPVPSTVCPPPGEPDSPRHLTRLIPQATIFLALSRAGNTTRPYSLTTPPPLS